MPADPVTLRTKRLVLRPFRLTDVNDVYAYASDEEWNRYLLGIPWPYSRRDAEGWLATVVQTDWSRGAQFAIEREGRVIGSLRVNPRVRPGVSEIGYGIGRPHWNQGLMTEAARAAVHWAFRRHEVMKVSATADAGNVASRRVLEKLGFRHEGTLRSHRLRRGERVDEVVYGLLKEEWASGDVAPSSTAETPFKASLIGRTDTTAYFEVTEAATGHRWSGALGRQRDPATC